MMKKQVSLFLLLILLLPQTSLAVSLQEELVAPGHYTTETFSTATGKSVFTVDAEVFVPQGEYTTIPLYEVELYSFTEDEIYQMAAMLGHEASGIKKEFQPAMNLWIGDWTGYEARNKNSRFSANIMNNQHTGKPQSAGISYLLEPGGSRPIYLTLPFALPIPSVLQQSDSLSEASRLAKDMAAKLAPELSLYLIGMTQTEPLVDYRDVERYNTHGDIELPRQEDMPQAYIFFFSRTFDGIPVTYTFEIGIRYTESGESYTDDFFTYERLVIVVAEEGIGAIEYESPYTVRGIWKQDAGELLAFDQIADVAKAILPLKYASSELEGVHASYHIHRITFGYARVMMPNEPDRCVMIPVWDFFGTDSFTLADDSIWASGNMIQSLLTVNAVTGAIIDRDLGY